MNRTIIIGDIHGCYYTLIGLLEKVKYDKYNDVIIFLGDYIDRGKNSFEVVNFLIETQKEVGKEKFICLMGNHEHMACTDISLWKRNGGIDTIESYEKNEISIEEHLDWFRTLELLYESENFICCHAGLPKSKISDNDIDDILWDRDWINNKVSPNEKQVIFGHTPSANLAYKTKNGNIGIDTACVFGYQLCALIITENDFVFTYENKNEKD